VMDPAVQTVSNSVGIPNYVLDGARSMQGVKYAVPLYSSGALVKLPGGNWRPGGTTCQRWRTILPRTIVTRDTCRVAPFQAHRSSGRAVTRFPPLVNGVCQEYCRKC